MNAAQVVEDLKKRFPNEPEYIQAVSQVLPTIEEEYNKHPEFEKANLIERLCTCLGSNPGRTTNKKKPRRNARLFLLYYLNLVPPTVAVEGSVCDGFLQVVGCNVWRGFKVGNGAAYTQYAVVCAG